MQEIKNLVFKINEKNSNEICQKIAYKLMCEYQLNINNSIFNISELEFYIYSDNHQDPYVHKHKLQKEFGKFYIHPKDGNYGGIDIIIGNQENEIYCGVLIRGLKSVNDNFFSGPNILKKEIYRILNVYNYKDLQDIADNKIQITKARNHQNILCSTRVGLKPKYEDYLKDGKYIYKLHRFITYAENKKHNFKEKENANKYNQKDNKTS